MKTYFYSALFAAALMCPSGYAQTPTLVGRANVPFNFQLGDTAMPAGQYNIRESDHMFMMDQVGGKNTVFRLSSPASRETAARENTLRFTRYGDEYYLTSFWNSYSGRPRAFGQSKREKEVIRKYRSFETAKVALQSPSR